MQRKNKSLKEKLYIIIFEADTPGGKAFDVVLLFLIGFSVLFVMLESVPSVNKEIGHWLIKAEWGITILFTIEYILRLWISTKTKKYLFSFYGIIDLLAVFPAYLGLIFPGTHGLSVVRSLRLLRVFRILKLTRYLSESNVLMTALRASKHKISVFLFAVIMLVTVLGSVMYIVESHESGFTSIPQSIYWAIVTLTTVGYGDIAPATVTGKFISSIVMIMGYAIIAVPTGIVSAEMTQLKNKNKASDTQCPHCGKHSKEDDARFCKYCGKSF